jgi:hypothetical protein
MTKADLHRVIDELPDDVIARLDSGTPVTFVLMQEGGRPVLREIDPEQAWFWTAEWRAGEREADADLAAGRGTVFRSDEAFLAHLDSIPPSDDSDSAKLPL